MQRQRDDDRTVRGFCGGSHPEGGDTPQMPDRKVGERELQRDRDYNRDVRGFCVGSSLANDDLTQMPDRKAGERQRDYNREVRGFCVGSSLANDDPTQMPDRKSGERGLMAASQAAANRAGGNPARDNSRASHRPTGEGSSDGHHGKVKDEGVGAWDSKRKRAESDLGTSRAESLPRWIALVCVRHIDRRPTDPARHSARNSRPDRRSSEPRFRPNAT